MTRAAIKYAQQLRRLKIPHSDVQRVEEILEAVPLMAEEMADPTVELQTKHTVINNVFPHSMRDFLKVLCDNQETGLLPEIFECYHQKREEGQPELHAQLIYVTPPTPEQREGILQFLRRKYGREDVKLDLKEDKSLMSGFKICVGNEEYDWSATGRVAQMKRQLEHMALSESEQGIISILRSEIDKFGLEVEHQEIGVVKSVGDGIANIDGIDHAFYGEIIVFDSGVKGMVQDIRRNQIGCILFGGDGDVVEGERVVRTGRRAGIPVGNAFKGRVVDALGAPIDGQGPIKADGYRPIESPAPGIVDRQSVTVPMETGILAIDSMFPIGRGQRELIIGDRQTGKTSIAVDTILNQKGKGVVCIYVAIGQKSSTVAKIVNNLKKFGAMDYTIVVSATASDSSPLQYIAPYSGTALGEYFMHKGQDVLIVYDDLSKHAVAYRAMSLLLERSPGREAYPGDVFYLHSRLLERSARLSEEKGGGSMTALPIIETQAGDLSAYIPTNVISITDGQIFLESNLFFSGQRPAVNVGLSVSRVGGAAQTKAMKKAAGSIRIDLAQFREMEVFTQFSSDLDDATREQLQYGAGLMELLKQPCYHPMSMTDQVITLVSATAKVFLHVPKERIKSFQASMLEHFASDYAYIGQELAVGKVLTDDLRQRIVTVAKAFLESQLNQM